MVHIKLSIEKTNDVAITLSIFMIFFRVTLGHHLCSKISWRSWYQENVGVEWGFYFHLKVVSNVFRLLTLWVQAFKLMYIKANYELCYSHKFFILSHEDNHKISHGYRGGGSETHSLVLPFFVYSLPTPFFRLFWGSNYLIWGPIRISGGLIHHL